MLQIRPANEKVNTVIVNLIANRIGSFFLDDFDFFISFLWGVFSFFDCKPGSAYRFLIYSSCELRFNFFTNIDLRVEGTVVLRDCRAIVCK